MDDPPSNGYMAEAAIVAPMNSVSAIAADGVGKFPSATSVVDSPADSGPSFPKASTATPTVMVPDGGVVPVPKLPDLREDVPAPGSSTEATAGPPGTEGVTVATDGVFIDSASGEGGGDDPAETAAAAAAAAAASAPTTAGIGLAALGSLAPSGGSKEPALNSSRGPSSDVDVNVNVDQGLSAGLDVVAPADAGGSAGTEEQFQSPRIRAPVTVDDDDEEEDDDDLVVAFVRQPSLRLAESEATPAPGSTSDVDRTDLALTSQPPVGSTPPAAVATAAAAATSGGDDGDGNAALRSPLISASPAISSEDAALSLEVGSDESDIVGLGGHSALMRLNELASGKPSLDTRVLQGVDEQEFGNRVAQLAIANQLAPDSPEINSIVDTLLPVVREVNSVVGGGSMPGGGSTESPGSSLTPAGPSIRATLTADDEEELLEADGEPEVMSRGVSDERVVVARQAGDVPALTVEQQKGALSGMTDMGATPEDPVGEQATAAAAAAAAAYSVATDGADGEDDDELEDETEEEMEVQRALASAAGLPVRVAQEEDIVGIPLTSAVAAAGTDGGLPRLAAESAANALVAGTNTVGEQKSEGYEQQAVAAPREAPSVAVAPSFPITNGMVDMALMQGEDPIGDEDDDVAEWDDEDDDEDEDDDVDDEVDDEDDDEEEVEEVDDEDVEEDEGAPARPPAFNPLMSNPRSAAGIAGLEGAGVVVAANGNSNSNNSNPALSGGSSSAGPTRAAGDPAQMGNPGGSGTGGTGGADSRAPALEPATRAVSASSLVGGSAGGGAAGSRSGGGAAGAATTTNPARSVLSGTGAQQAQAGSGAAAAAEEPTDQFREKREKLQNIRVKLLRVAQRLGRSARDNVVAQVLYRLELAEQLRAGRSLARGSVFAFDRAAAIAEEQEAAAGADSDLDFTCTIMLLGKTGVGKSATINSIFDQPLCSANAFLPETKTVREVVGTVHGIQVRIIDTPALQPSMMDQRKNEQIMASVKRFVKKRSPDIVLYVDRLDMQSRDYGDLPLLKTITDTFGPSVWFNAIVVLTHASAAPPEGSNGQPISYEMYVAQRSHVVQQTIRQVAGDMRLMNPVALVENHPNCRTNRSGQKVLPNGQVWKPHLLLLCFASKILAEANALLNLQESSSAGRSLGGGGGGGGFGGGGGGRGFGARPKVPPLPFLLSSLITSRPPRRSPYEDAERSDEESESGTSSSSDEESEGEEEEQTGNRVDAGEEEGDELDEEEREGKKGTRTAERSRRRAERRRMRELKENRKKEMEAMAAEEEDEENKPKQVAVPAPDPALPPSFDSDNPAHRYRFMESASQWLVRPIVENHGWDHDSGIDGFSLDKAFMVRKRIPANVSGQITKDKKDANLTLEMEGSIPHDDWRVTTSGFDVQTVGKDLAFTLRSETRFKNLKNNKTVGGLSMSMVGGSMAGGLKLEDRLKVGKRLKLVVSGGAITGGDPGTFVRARGDVAYGGNMEVTITRPNPEDPTRTTIGLSMMDWRGDVALGGNLQTQFVWGKAMMVTRANLNSRGQGQISIRTSSNELLQIGLVGLIPMLKYLFTRNQDISPDM